MLEKLNTHAVGYVAIGAGGVSFAALGKLLTDPTYLVALYGAVIRGSQHLETPTDISTDAQLVAAVFGLILSFAIAYFSRPKTV